VLLLIVSANIVKCDTLCDFMIPHLTLGMCFLSDDKYSATGEDHKDLFEASQILPVSNEI